MSCVLSDQAIRELLSDNINIVSPYVADNLQPASIDLTLGNQRYEYHLEEYVLGQDIEDHVTHSTFDVITLERSETAFIGIAEKIVMPDDMIGIIFPRSSITRLGIHIGTSFINPGYEGVIPVTITNNSAMKISIAPGYKVVQMVVVRLSDVAETGYNKRNSSKYNDEVVDHSRLQDDADIQSKIDKIIQQMSPSLFAMMKK